MPGPQDDFWHDVSMSSSTWMEVPLMATRIGGIPEVIL